MLSWRLTGKSSGIQGVHKGRPTPRPLNVPFSNTGRCCIPLQNIFQVSRMSASLHIDLHEKCDTPKTYRGVVRMAAPCPGPHIHLCKHNKARALSCPDESCRDRPGEWIVLDQSCGCDLSLSLFGGQDVCVVHVRCSPSRITMQVRLIRMSGLSLSLIGCDG